MYRCGISAARIAELARAASSTVRYHLQLAVAAEPELKTAHQAALKPKPRGNKAGIANMADVVALYDREGRLPSTKSKAPRERALAVWILRRRQDTFAGTLDPVYKTGLEAVPGWEQRTRYAKDAAQWGDRMARVIAHVAAGNDWPRHKNTETEEERVLGVWLQYQRTKLAAGQLSSGKADRLDNALPGWRDGRVKGRRKRASQPPLPHLQSPAP